jgi:hypothetical protein
VSVVVATERLRYELALRGWGNGDLARVAGISAPTVTAVLAGKPIAPGTFRKIAIALTKESAVAGADSILGRPPGWTGSHLGVPLRAPADCRPSESAESRGGLHPDESD